MRGATLPPLLIGNSGSSSNSKMKKEQPRYAWVILTACLIIITINAGIRFSFGVFFEPLQVDFDLTRTLTSGILSVYSMFGCIFSLICGWILDRYEPKLVFTAMGLATALSLLLTSQANTLAHLYLTYSLLLAIGTGPSWVVVAATISRWFADSRGLALGIASSGIGLGTLILTPTAAYLISIYGWRSSFLILGVIAFFIIIPCAQFLRKPATEIATLPKGEKTELTNKDSAEGTSYYNPRERPLLQITKSKNLWLFLLIWFLSAFCIIMVITHLVRYGIDLGFTSLQASSILAMIGGVSIVGRVAIGRASDILGRKQVAMACALFIAIAMLLLIKASSLWMLYLFAVIFGLFYGGLMTVVGAFIAETFGLSHIGAIFGIIEIGWAGGSGLGPVLAGYVFDNSGNYIFAFIAGSIAMLMIFVLIYLVKPTRGRELRQRMP